MAKNNVPEVNEFDETLAASKSFFEKNKKTIVYGGSAILAIIIAVLLTNQFYIQPRNQKANEALAKAEQLFMAGTYDKALNGDGESAGFLGVIDSYGSTKAGNLACLYAGICYAKDNKFQEAADMLEKFDGCGDAMISPAAIGMLGNVYAELGNNEKAAAYLVKAADAADNNTLSPIFLVQAGQIFEALGNNDKALDCYKKVKTNYLQSQQNAEVEKYIERLSK